MDGTLERMELFREMLKCVNMAVLTEYGPDLSVLSSTSEHADIQEDFFTASFYASAETNFLGVRNAMQGIEELGDQLRPFVFLDHLGMAWISDVWMDGGHIRRIYMLGPVFLDDFSVEHIEQALDQMSLSISLRQRLMDYICDIPVITIGRLYEYGIMMHYCITGQRMSVSEFCYPYPENEDGTEESFSLKHGTYAVEKEILRLVEEGNLEYQEVWNRYVSTGELGKTGSGEYLRSQKNLVIMFTTLCSRAAIRGGLVPETAFSLCDRYMKRVEDAKSLAQLVDVSHSMFRDFVLRVHRRKNQAGSVSPQVRKACDYIELHLENRIDIHTLASLVGYADYYFSNKFKRETGLSIRDYVMHCKVERSKQLLKDTKLSIQEISEALGFSVQNHFAAVFRKLTGMSPTEYRENA